MLMFGWFKREGGRSKYDPENFKSEDPKSSTEDLSFAQEDTATLTEDDIQTERGAPERIYRPNVTGTENTEEPLPINPELAKELAMKAYEEAATVDQYEQLPDENIEPVNEPVPDIAPPMIINDDIETAADAAAAAAYHAQAVESKRSQKQATDSAEARSSSTAQERVDVQRLKQEQAEITSLLNPLLKQWQDAVNALASTQEVQMVPGQEQQPITEYTDLDPRTLNPDDASSDAERTMFESLVRLPFKDELVDLLNKERAIAEQIQAGSSDKDTQEAA